MKQESIRVGDDVLVLDAGLSLLRSLQPTIPPNHHGRVQSIEGETIMVEFPIDGSYKHSQVAPYPIEDVRKRNSSS